jgi:hypothetical protein
MALEDKISQFSQISTTKVGTNNLKSDTVPNTTKIGTNNLSSNITPVSMKIGTNNLSSNIAAGGQYSPQGGGTGNTPLSQADVTPGEGLAK